MKFFYHYFLICTLVICYGCGESSISQRTITGGDSDDDSEVTYGSVSGKVTDSLDASTNISGATVYVTGYQSTLTTTTASNGTFSIAEVPSGSRTLVTTKSNYSTDESTVTVTADTTTSDIPISIIETAQASGKYIIKLSWSTSTSLAVDLDSHLLIPTTNSNGVNGTCRDFDNTTDNKADYVRLNYQKKVGSSQDGSTHYLNNDNQDIYAALDRDDTNGGSDGVETTRFIMVGNKPKCQVTGKPYKFYVYNFREQTGASSLTQSGATVKLYREGTKLGEWAVPTGGNESHHVWKVFSLDKDGNLTETNSLAADCDAPYSGGCKN